MNPALQRLLIKKKFPLVVELKQEALIKAITYAGIVAETHGGVEYGGLMYGIRKSENEIVIVDVVVGKTYATGGFTEVDEPIHKFIKDARGKGLEVVGLWHSHPFNSRSPSHHEDIPTLKTWEKMLGKTPLMLIVTFTSGYWLGCSRNGCVREVISYMPEKRTPFYNCGLDEIRFSRRNDSYGYDNDFFGNPYVERIPSSDFGTDWFAHKEIFAFFEWVSEKFWRMIL